MNAWRYGSVLAGFWCFLLYGAEPHATAQLEARAIFEKANNDIFTYPDKALGLLLAEQHKSQSLPPEEQFDWYRLQLTAAIALGNKPQILQDLQQLTVPARLPMAGKRAVQLLTALGIHLRSNNHLSQANRALFCAMHLAVDRQQRMSLVNTIAINFTQQDHHDLAIAVNQQLLTYARKNKDLLYEGLALHNIAVIHNARKEAHLAIPLLTEALAIYQRIGHKAHMTNAGINLLIAYLETQQLALYFRLHTRVGKQVQGSSNNDHHAVMVWLAALAKVRNGDNLTSTERVELNKAFAEISSVTRRRFLYDFANELGLTELQVPSMAPVETPMLAWFQTYPPCQQVPDTALTLAQISAVLNEPKPTPIIQPSEQ